MMRLFLRVVFTIAWTLGVVERFSLRVARPFRRSAATTTTAELQSAARRIGCTLVSDEMLTHRAAARGRVHHPLHSPIIVSSIDELMPNVVEVDS